MRSSALAIALVLLSLAGGAPPARAELLRIQVSRVSAEPLPREFQQFATLVSRNIGGVVRLDGDYYDPYYSNWGGANYGWAEIQTLSGDYLTITWMRCDSAEIALRMEEEWEAVLAGAPRGTGESVAWIREGELVVHANSYGTGGTDAEAILEEVFGPR